MAIVSCARFAGTDKVHFIDQQDIDSILAAVDEVPKFIRRNTRMGAIIESIKRKDVPEYSPIAIRVIELIPSMWRVNSLILSTTSQELSSSF